MCWRERLASPLPSVQILHPYQNARFAAKHHNIQGKNRALARITKKAPLVVMRKRHFEMNVATMHHVKSPHFERDVLI